MLSAALQAMAGPRRLEHHVLLTCPPLPTPNTIQVFVAGATGRLGLRIVRELLLAGFKVRAGARNTDKAQEYADLALSLGVVSPDAAKRLQIVAVDLEEEDTIVAAIGNAGKVWHLASSA